MLGNKVGETSDSLHPRAHKPQRISQLSPKLHVRLGVQEVSDCFRYTRRRTTMTRLQKKPPELRARAPGFTLIEVMVTVAIVAILASLALPSYTDYVRRGRIPEATSNLSASNAKMEQWFQDAKSYYATGSTSACGVSISSSSTSYTITATGTSTMAGFVYTIDQDGTRTTTITGVSGWTATSSSCWITTRGGSC
jgi:type IV pilus assembly protein PilE